MKRISFYNTNRSDNTLHIETENCVVNIRVNLHDKNGKEVTSIEIIPDKYADKQVYFDGCTNNRVIRVA